MLVSSNFSIITCVLYLHDMAELFPMINVFVFRKHGFLSAIAPILRLPEAALPHLAGTEMKMPLERAAEGAL